MKETKFSLILKVAEPSEQKSDNNEHYKSTSSIENEIHFYSQTLDEMHRVLQHAGEAVQLGPK